MRFHALIAGLCFASQLTFLSTARAAPLVNGDFSSGFDGWSGLVTDIFFVDVSVPLPPGSFPLNYDESSGTATLTTTTLDNDIFAVNLFQVFDLPVILPGEMLELNYDLSFSLSDPDPSFGDLAFAQLGSGPGFLSTLDLLSAGGTVDVTSLAGGTVELLFGLEDFDGGITNFIDPEDLMLIDNIVISLIPAPSGNVPEPGTVAMLGLGLLGIFGARVRRRAGTW